MQRRMYKSTKEHAAEAEQSAHYEFNNVKCSLKHGWRLLQRCRSFQISAAEIWLVLSGSRPYGLSAWQHCDLQQMCCFSPPPPPPQPASNTNKWHCWICPPNRRNSCRQKTSFHWQTPSFRRHWQKWKAVWNVQKLGSDLLEITFSWLRSYFHRGFCEDVKRITSE